MIFLLVIVFIASLQGFASEIYAPSLLSISSDLRVGVDQVQATIAIYLLGASCLQLVYGPVSDRYGRRSCLIFGIGLFCLGCFLASMSRNFDTLYYARFFQGAGVAATSSLWRALFRDRFEGDDLIRYSGMIGSLMVVVVPLAPMIGGFIESHYTWQYSFYFLAVYGVFLITLAFWGVEDRVVPQKKTIRSLFEGFGTVLGSADFRCYALCALFTNLALMAWFTAAPIIYIDRLSLSPGFFGVLCFFTTATCMMMGSFSVSKLVGRVSGHTIMRVGLLLSILAALALMLVEYSQEVSVLYLASIGFVYFYGCGFVWPVVAASALNPFGEMAGTAAAVYGATQAFGGFLGAHLIAFCSEEDLYPVASVLLICASLSMLLSCRSSQE